MSCDHPYSVFGYFFRGDCAEIFSQAPGDPSVGLAGYLFFFIMTCVFEWPWYRSASRVIGLNLLTHPLVVWAWPVLIRKLGGGYGVYLLTAEAFAPAVEAWALHRFWRVPVACAILLALGANLFSWWVGGEVVIRWIWPRVQAWIPA